MENFSKKLIAWYKKHGRFDLPWQKNQSAYRVWISEIMLQQTQVTTVIPYYECFMKRFPSIKQLALADEDSVLTHWSGLGYYARARNLHKTAKIIHEQHHGRFPQSVEALEALPGIGKSTAGAILSFAFCLPTTICDGNVKRVLARCFAIDKPKQTTEATKIFWALSTKLTPQKNTHLYNQAIMDLGATLCTRTKPRCNECPFEKNCEAHKLSEETKFPVSKKKKANPTKHIHMLIFQNKKGELLLEKRPPVGIWGSLWSFPECEIDIDINSWVKKAFGLKITKQKELNLILHKFSHFNLKIRPLLLEVNPLNNVIFEKSVQCWYNTDTDLPGGIAAPVAALLKKREKQ